MVTAQVSGVHPLPRQLLDRRRVFLLVLSKHFLPFLVVTRLVLNVLGKLLVNRGWVLKRLIRPAIVFPRNRHVLFSQRATVNLIRALVRCVVADNRLNFDQRWPAGLLRVADCLGNRVQVSTILNQLVIPVGSLKAGGSTFVRTQTQRPIEGHIV